MKLSCVKLTCAYLDIKSVAYIGLDKKDNAILCKANLFLHRQEEYDMYGSKLCIPSECLVERGRILDLNHGVLSWSRVGGGRRGQRGIIETCTWERG